MSVTQIGQRAVLHRHDKAMSWATWTTNRPGSSCWSTWCSATRGVDEAFRVAMHGTRSSARRAAVYELRARGLTLQQIPDELGYADQSGPSRILSTAG